MADAFKIARAILSNAAERKKKKDFLAWTLAVKGEEIERSYSSAMSLSLISFFLFRRGRSFWLISGNQFRFTQAGINLEAYHIHN